MPNKWKCIKCGSCCRFVFDTDLDDGTGICKFLKDNACTIYNKRPDICRVDKHDRTDKELIGACNLLRKIRKEMKE